MKKDERREEVRRRWYELPENERTEAFLYLFFHRHCRGIGTNYEEVKTFLADIPKHEPKPSEE